jgi:hypothetical protein
MRYHDAAMATPFSASKPSRTSPSTRAPGAARAAAPPPSAIGGKLYVAAAIVLVMGAICGTAFGDGLAARVLDALKLAEAPPVDMTRWEAGKSEEIAITLVTADYTKLACSYPREVGARTASTRPTPNAGRWRRTRPWTTTRRTSSSPTAPFRQRLRPHRRALAQPEVAMRLHAEPPGNTPAKNLAGSSRAAASNRSSGSTASTSAGTPLTSGPGHAEDGQ